MKMKRIFSGILAAVMSLAVVAMPITGFADPDPDPEADKCVIQINHPATGGTYMAYPIFVSNDVKPETKMVKQSDGTEKEEKTGRLLINNPEFHSNMNTARINYNIGTSTNDEVGLRGTTASKDLDYGLWKFLNETNQVNFGEHSETGKNQMKFEELIGKYDPQETYNGFSGIGGKAGDFKTQVQAIASTLNLTKYDSATAVTSGILNSTKTGAFYSAFAEAARMFMVDNAVCKYDATSDNGVDLTADERTAAKNSLVSYPGTKVKDGDNDIVKIVFDQPGYYLVEYTPADYDSKKDDYEGSPRAVRRALVLVGKKGECGISEITSKDTENRAQVDIWFNEYTLDKVAFDNDGTISYNNPKLEDGDTADSSKHWMKNVSAGNGDYVNCRIEVKLPGNLAAYDQYYLAVPIMYGYNGITSTGFFDYQRSVSRQGDDDDVDVKLYSLQNDGTYAQCYEYGDENTYNLNGLGGSIVTPNSTPTATMEQKDVTFADDDKPDEDDKNTANQITTYRQDKFKATDAFLVKDIMKLKLGEKTIKEYANQGLTLKLAFTFPVKFDRFYKENALPDGVGHPGYNSSSSLWGDDALMKNYISARVIYSNNPNLHVPTEDDYERADDWTEGTLLSEENRKKDADGKYVLKSGVKLYLDTTKAINSLQNPVGTTKNTVSANIVTYRLRVHATTDDLLDLCPFGGLEGLEFYIRRGTAETGYEYAQVAEFSASSLVQTYDQVKSGEGVENDSTHTCTNGNGKHIYSAGREGKVRVYKISKWVKGVETKVDGKTKYDIPSGIDFITCNDAGSTEGAYANNYTGRFEIVGLAPGDYTVVVRKDDSIQAAVAYQNELKNLVDYKLPKEDGQNYLKTEYRFSFAPELNQDIGKQLYNTHFAPEGSTAPTTPTGSDIVAGTMIKDYHLKWYDMEGNEIARDKATWWLGERTDVGLMSMRVTYIKKGLSLPVTGGIGTFIFFAVGGALVVISTVAIVTKFRIKREQL